MRLAGQGSARAHFRIQIDRAGVYPVRVAIRSLNQQRDLKVQSDLRVMETDGELAPHDTVSALIDAGEAMLEEPVDVLNGAALHREAGGFVFSTTLAISSLRRPELRKRLEDTMPDHEGPRTGDAYLRSLVRSRVRALYDIRRELKH
jgi:hypothetical protein